MISRFFFLNFRRVKADVDLKIPPKKEVIVYCPMTETQSTFYKATVDQTIAAMVQDDDKKGNNVFYVKSIFHENNVKLTFFVYFFQTYLSLMTVLGRKGLPPTVLILRPFYKRTMTRYQTKSSKNISKQFSKWKVNVQIQ